MAKKNDAQTLLKALNEASPEAISRDLNRMFSSLDIYETGGALYLLGGIVERKLKVIAGMGSKAARARQLFNELEVIFNDIENKR